MSPARGPRLAGKVAIVTGAGSRAEGIGNGRAAAILFAREGAKVLLVDQNREWAETTLKMIEAESGEAAVCVADVTKSDECRAMVAEAVRRWGRLDILDNNVGIGGRGTVVEMPLEEWERIMHVNVTGMMLASKHAIPAMVKGGGGAIVNISSISALRPRGLTAYSASKGAVIALTRAMAIDHAAEGIRVNCIAPGPVETEGYLDVLTKMDKAAADKAYKSVAARVGMQRWGKVHEIAYPAIFLASDASSFITGETIIIDGGPSPREMEG